MTRWPIVCALLAEPDAESRRLIAALSGLPARGKVYKPLDREAKRPGPTGVPPGKRQILDALADTPLKPFAIATRIGRTPGAIRATLGVMREAGRVVRLPDGTYRAASRACEAANDRDEACEMGAGGPIAARVNGAAPTGGRYRFTGPLSLDRPLTFASTKPIAEPISIPIHRRRNHAPETVDRP